MLLVIMAHTRTVGDNRFYMYLMYFLHVLYLSVFRCISVGVVHTGTVGDRDVRI